MIAALPPHRSRAHGLAPTPGRKPGLAALLPAAQAQSPPVLGSTATTPSRRLHPTSSSPSVLSENGSSGVVGDNVARDVELGIANVEEKMRLKTRIATLEKVGRLPDSPVSCTLNTCLLVRCECQYWVGETANC